jgi:hypothetical protein
MNSIVVYRIIIASGFLILATGLLAQKPAIDLISSHRQYRHPEAIIDTGYTVNPPVREAVLTQLPPAQKQNLKGESVKKKRRQIGPSLDSLFQKEDNGNIKQEKQPLKISLFNRKYNPIKFLIYITAFK